MGDNARVEFSREELERYSRQCVLPELGSAGQAKLKQARVLVVGAGGLGSPALLYLAAAGVGTLGIVDGDTVDVSNLHRQILHGTGSLGDPKTVSAVKRLADLNPHVNLRPYATRLTSENAFDILRGYDVVIDGSDNFPTRYLVNDACVLLNLPYVYGSVFRFEGQVSVFDARTGPCYRCLYAEPPPPDLVPNCAEGGVLGMLPGIIGSLQAAEAVKLLLGAGESLVGRLLLFDALTMEMHKVRLRKNPQCPLCGEHPTQRHLIDYEQFCGRTPTSQTTKDMIPAMTVEELKQRMDKKEDLFILDVRQPNEHAFVNIGGLVIPLGELPSRLGELDPARETVVYCRSGSRSAHAVQLLMANGFSNVKNLAGGILAWANRIDPSLPKY